MPGMYMDVDTALSEVPVNIAALIDDTDFKTREEAVVFNQAGLDLLWNFVTSAGDFTQTAVTPTDTTGGDYNWVDQGNAMYTIAMPASGGASINNDTEGYGWFSGFATGVLPWIGPTIGFRAAGLNDKLMDNPYSETRGLAGTFAPDAVAEAPGGLFTRGTGAGQINQDANGRIDANAAAISQDSVAADNLESQYDTTGLVGDTFPSTQLQLSNIALTGSAVSTPARDAPLGFNITFGENEANDEDSTHALDGTTHDIEAQNDAGTERIDVYYEFTIGGDGVSTGISAHHQLDRGGGGAKNLAVYAFNWGTSTFDQIGTFGSSTSLETDSFTLFTAHVGTGANLGLVRIRYATGTVAFSSTTKLLVDRIFVEYAIVRRTTGYELGSVWINTVTGTAGTEPFVNGTADKAVNNLADAITIAANVGLNRFVVSSNSTITFAEAHTNETWVGLGRGWTLALGGQDVSGSHILGAIVTGTATTPAKDVHFERCEIGAVTVGHSHFEACHLDATITLSDADEYVFYGCASEGSAGCIIDFGAAAGSTHLDLQGFSGEIEIQNMGQAGTDTAEISGNGHLTTNVNSTGGTIQLHGAWNVVPNGATVINRDEVATGVKLLAVDTLTLPGQVVPPQTPTYIESQMHLYKAWLNDSEQDGSQQRLFNAAGTVVDQKRSINKTTGGTVELGKVEAGPA